jgi:hypothetical protein
MWRDIKKLQDEESGLSHSCKKSSHYAQLWALKVEPITMFESKKGTQKVQKEEAHDVYLQNILLRASFAPMCCSQFLLLRIPSRILNF